MDVNIIAYVQYTERVWYCTVNVLFQNTYEKLSGGIQLADGKRREKKKTMARRKVRTLMRERGVVDGDSDGLLFR